MKCFQDAANLLFNAFRQAHLDIVAQTHGLTTLCVGLLLPIPLTERHRNRDGRSRQSSAASANTSSCNGSSTGAVAADDCPLRYALVVASVGDSQAFLLREGTDAVEITGWVPHGRPTRAANGGNDLDGEPESQPERDFRDAGGALGAVHKDSGEPELQNLMCAGTYCTTCVVLH